MSLACAEQVRRDDPVAPFGFLQGLLDFVRDEQRFQYAKLEPLPYAEERAEWNNAERNRVFVLPFATDPHNSEINPMMFF